MEKNEDDIKQVIETIKTDISERASKLTDRQMGLSGWMLVYSKESKEVLYIKGGKEKARKQLLKDFDCMWKSGEDHAKVIGKRIRILREINKL